MLAALLAAEAQVETDEDRLAKMFSPILILTEETGGKWGDIKVQKPEPVGIMGATSADNIWFKLSNLSNQVVGSDRLRNLIDTGVLTSADVGRNQREWFPAPKSVDLLNNKYAFFNSTVPLNTYNVYEGSLVPGIHSLEMYLNFPGTDTESWNQAYLGLGDKHDHPQRGSQWPNTAYVHIYTKTIPNYEAQYDPVTVIQYFYFYPYNDWWNNHEGDWQRIDVVVSSDDPETAVLLGVEYRFHKAWLSYYKDWSNKPGLTTSFSFNPKTALKLNPGPERDGVVQYTHPVVYVGAGSHAGFPVGGNVQI